jgi:hypothetical protein
LERPEGEFEAAVGDRVVMQRERRPLAITRKTRSVTFGEEPFEAS